LAIQSAGQELLGLIDVPAAVFEVSEGWQREGTSSAIAEDRVAAVNVTDMKGQR
jgi:hypothetical protein